MEFVTIQMKTTIFFKLIDTKQTKLNFSCVIVTSIVSCAPLKKQHLRWFIFARDAQIQ